MKDIDGGLPHAYYDNDGEAMVSQVYDATRQFVYVSLTLAREGSVIKTKEENCCEGL